MHSFRSHGLPLFLLLALIIGLRTGLDQGLNWGFQKAIHKAEAERPLHITYKNIHSVGLRGVRIHELKVYPSNIYKTEDTILSSQDLKIVIRLLPLLRGQVSIDELEMNQTRLALLQHPDYSNYQAIFRDKPDQEQDLTKTFSQKISRLFRLIFQGLPQRMTMKDLQVDLLRKGVRVRLYSEEVRMRGQKLMTTLRLDQRTVSDSIPPLHENWIVEGSWNKDAHQFEGMLRGLNPGDSIHIPYINISHQASIAFNKMHFKVHFSDLDESDLSFASSASVEGLRINYWRLAPQTILTDKVSIRMDGSLEDNHLILERSSFFRVKDFILHPYLDLDKDKNYKIRFELDEKDISAKDFQAALPKGMFSELDSVRADGTFDFRFAIQLDMGKPDSVQVECAVTHDRIRLLSPGNLTKLNGGFSYTAYLYGKPVRTFYIGESNPNFRRLSQISPMLQQAVLHSEDGNFYAHKGFSMKGFRLALAYDIKAKRFAKGGSTISMQLVKNVFLDRNKNLFRKAEEAMIVWLIENKGLCSKSRMLEVYLNLIEWGPRIYGAEEASQFYFAKSCSELEPDEAIFLASIIPTPRWYASAFNEQGELKETRYGHFRIVGGILSRNGTIPPIDPATYVPHVEIKGPAKEGLRTIPTQDSTLLLETL